MLRLAILAPLLLFSGIPVAQTVYVPDCTASGWKWSYNSLGQNPCSVAELLLETCNGGDSVSIPQLNPGAGYIVFVEDLCGCNTVTYSLLSACGLCQGDTWNLWSSYSSSCTSRMPASSFPNPVPSGTRVPQWALLDVTLEDTWNITTSRAVGDTPEVAPGTVISPSNASPTSPTPTPTLPTPSPTPTTPSPTPTQSSSSNTGAIAGGAIAGGVAGGVAAIAVAGLAIFFSRRRKRPQGPSAAFMVDGAPQPLMGEVRPPGSDDGTHGPSSMPGTPASPMMLYDPNDPTTFSGFQGAGQVRTEVPVTPYSGNTQANIKSSPPPEYHSLPIV